ncbi:MAG: hypothetical protein EA402_02080 [Planctomycetota bacterium]|nr:MAG: hypothetical protein EA402_02080 [Planctomycetota bacterium]
MDLWQADLEARRREIDGFQERYHQAPAIDEVVADRDLVHASSWQLYYYGLAIQSLRQIRRYPQEFGFHDDQRIVEWEDRFHGQLHEDWPGFLELTRLHAQSRPRLCVRLAVIMGEAYRLNHQRPDLLPFSEVDEEKVFQQLQEVFTFSLEDFDEPNRSVLQALQVNAVCEFLQWSLGLVLADVEQEHLAIRALAQWRILQSEGIVALAADDPKINSSSGLAYIFAAQVFSALGHQSEAMALVQRLSDSNNFLSWNARLWARCFE